MSVLTITYNQEAFIGQAIESVVSQEYPGQIEMMIGSDCSSDETDAIVADYASRYPDLVKPLPRPQNLGAPKNFFQTWKQCVGDYIALLDGDDYWTSPMKIREQVTVMEADPSLTFAFHRTNMRYPDGNVMTIPPDPFGPVLSLGDLIAGNIVPSCSVMYRANVMRSYPEWLRESPIVDYALHFLHALAGPFAFIDRNWSDYRIHDSNTFAGLALARQECELLRVRDHLRASVPADLLASFDRSQGDIQARIGALQASVS